MYPINERQNLLQCSHARLRVQLSDVLLECWLIAMRLRHACYASAMRLPID